MVIFEPRIWLSSCRDSLETSRPWKLIEPETSPLPAGRPITARKVWLLPEPLSPTMPRHSPGATSNDSDFTASTRPSGVSNATLRFRTSRMGWAKANSAERRHFNPVQSPK